MHITLARRAASARVCAFSPSGSYGSSQFTAALLASGAFTLVLLSITPNLSEVPNVTIADGVNHCCLLIGQTDLSLPGHFNIRESNLR